MSKERLSFSDWYRIVPVVNFFPAVVFVYLYVIDICRYVIALISCHSYRLPCRNAKVSCQVTSKDAFGGWTWAKRLWCRVDVRFLRSFFAKETRSTRQQKLMHLIHDMNWHNITLQHSVLEYHARCTASSGPLVFAQLDHSQFMCDYFPKISTISKILARFSAALRISHSSNSSQSECVQNSQYLHRSFENLCHWIWTISMTSINVLDEICDHTTSKEQFFTWKRDAFATLQRGHQNQKNLSVALCVSPAARHGVSSLAPARQSHAMRMLNNVESHEQMVPKRCWRDCDTSLGGNMAASCAMTSERFRTYRVRVSMQRTEDTARKL